MEEGLHIEFSGLHAKSISVTGADGRKILDSCAIDIDAGEAYALTGEDARAKRLLVRVLSSGLAGTPVALCDDQSTLCGLPVSGKAAFAMDLGRCFAFMTCREYLRYTFSGVKMSRDALMPRVEELLAAVCLGGRADVKIKRLTRCEYLLLCLAAALFSNAGIVLLNADTLRFGKGERERLNAAVASLKAANKAVLVNLADVRFAGGAFDLIGILKGGKICMQGTHADILSLKSTSLRLPTLSSAYRKVVNGNEF